MDQKVNQVVSNDFVFSQVIIQDVGVVEDRAVADSGDGVVLKKEVFVILFLHQAGNMNIFLNIPYPIKLKRNRQYIKVGASADQEKDQIGFNMGKHSSILYDF